MIACPRIDRRGAEDIVAQLRTLLRFYTPELEAGEGGDPQVEAMMRIFARFGALTIDRLNRVPEKNFLAFLNLTGIVPLPPRAASVPLTFYLGAQNSGSAVVPAHTQVAAELLKGETKQVLFETESEFVITAARLASLFVKDGQKDSYRDWTNVIGPASPPSSPQVAASLPAFAATPKSRSDAAPWLPSPHALFIGLPSRTVWPAENELRLRFDIEQNAAAFPDARVVQWEICEPPPAAALAGASPVLNGPSSMDQLATIKVDAGEDTTEGLLHSGTVFFRNLPQPKPVSMDGCVGFWMVCRLLTPISSDGPRPGAVQSAHISPVREITVETEFESDNVAVDFIFFNNAALDLTKDFFPFGERPKFGDTLYVASKGFADPDALVTANIELTNPYGATDAPIEPVARQGARLQWEFWNGTDWALLGIGEATASGAAKKIRFARDTPPTAAQDDFSDETRALTVSGSVSFHFGQPPAPCMVNNKLDYWVRVRIVGGGYGNDVVYQQDASGKYTVTPASFAPPSIRSLKVGVLLEHSSRPAAITVFNDFVATPVQSDAAFIPFTPVRDEDPLPAVYLGFLPPAPSSAQASAAGKTQPFSARSMSLYVGLAVAPAAARTQADQSAPRESELWEYWNGSAWSKWTIRDGTQGLTRNGIIRILAPPDYRISENFGLGRYWLRMRKQTAGFDPCFGNALLNTTMAREGSSVFAEILGTGTGRPGQVLHTIQSPVLAGQSLEVREASPPGREELRRIEAEEGVDAMRPSTVANEAGQVWVRWHEVANFEGSSARDRHYMLDRVIGAVRFGDGINGLVPQALPGNIRMAAYRAGGGMRGNKPPLTIQQLKSAVPYIDKVVNWVEAGGGGDAEDVPSVLDRGPRLLRHGDRAVAPEDFEDLALAASSQVALAKCFSTRDLRKSTRPQQRRPGFVSLIVVPRSSDPAPLPSGELLANVRAYLMERCSPTIQLVVMGPEYLKVDVAVEVAVDDPDTADDVELAVTLALQRFLHPVFGGREGAGWAFGREPHKSDLWALIEGVSGVSHVRGIRIHTSQPQAATDAQTHLLICAGDQTVTITLQD